MAYPARQGKPARKRNARETIRRANAAAVRFRAIGPLSFAAIMLADVYPESILSQFPGKGEIYLRHTFVAGMAHRNEKVSLPALAKACSSSGGTKTKLPGPTSVSPSLRLTVPFPERTNTSCSHAWEWNGV